MPPDLVKAHEELDRLVELCYRRAAGPKTLARFKNDSERVEFLLQPYAALIAPLLAAPPKKGRRAAKK